MGGIIVHTERIKRAVSKMKEHDIHQMIVTSTTGIFYLTGAWIDPGERLLALYIDNKGSTTLILNELFKNNSSISGANVVTYDDGSDPIKLLSKIISVNEPLGIDKSWPAHFLIELMEQNRDMKFVNSSAVIDEIRMIKDAEEIAALKESSRIADKVMEELPHRINGDMSEKQMAKVVCSTFEKYGVDKLSFDTIVSYGKNCADPHHIIDDSRPKAGDSIVIDMGGVYNRYCSDITRTFFYGTPCEEARKIYDIVLEANLNAISMVKPGVTLSKIDDAARSVIAKAGYGQYFTHRTGHNIGIEDHEYPSVSSTESLIAQPGMVFSIEPGIYIPGKYGVRIEDLVLVTETGVEVLNHYPKNITVL